MKEVEFREYLFQEGLKSKVVTDTISRLKRIEREMGPCDIDAEYRKDHCEKLLKAFLKSGENDEMKTYAKNPSLPIGKYYMSTYRHAIKRYVAFCDESK